MLGVNSTSMARTRLAECQGETMRTCFCSMCARYRGQSSWQVAGCRLCARDVAAHVKHGEGESVSKAMLELRGEPWLK